MATKFLDVIVSIVYVIEFFVNHGKFRPAERGPALPCTRRYGALQDKLHGLARGHLGRAFG